MRPFNRREVSAALGVTGGSITPQADRIECAVCIEPAGEASF